MTQNMGNRERMPVLQLFVYHWPQRAPGPKSLMYKGHHYSPGVPLKKGLDFYLDPVIVVIVLNHFEGL